MRLDKYICKSTEYSLVQARVLIEKGTVCINGLISTNVSDQAHKNNTVAIAGKVITLRSFRYLLLNKPIDMICSNVDEKHPSIFKLLDTDRKTELHIAGRLDADTTGLVLITDDGHWSFNLTLPKNGCEKVYQVQLSRPIADDAVERFLAGVILQGDSKLTRPATLQIIDPFNVSLTITEGRYHQVKRMFAAIGNRVKKLHRHQIGDLELDVEIGQWRNLTQTEVEMLSIRT
jgi:16S rRNA pseudouridine516 synthase